MKIKTIACLVLAGMLSLNSCVKDDIDGLQNQINDLNSKVEDLESTQQEALLAAISKLEAELASLNNQLDSREMQNEGYSPIPPGRGHML